MSCTVRGGSYVMVIAVGGKGEKMRPTAVTLSCGGNKRGGAVLGREMRRTRTN